jgi:hypothetical protein
MAAINILCYVFTTIKRRCRYLIVVAHPAYPGDTHSLPGNQHFCQLDGGAVYIYQRDPIHLPETIGVLLLKPFEGAGTRQRRVK